MWWRSLSRPELVNVWKGSWKWFTHRSHRSQSNYSTIVSNYHGHLETCWACNPQYQEDSLYPHSLTKSPCDITLRDSLKLPWTLVFCLYNACCLQKWAHFESRVVLLFKTNGSLSTGMWPGRWNCADWTIMTSHARLSLRSQIGDGVRWHIRDRDAGFTGGKTNTIPQRPQPVCLLWAAAVSPIRLNYSGLT